MMANMADLLFRSREVVEWTGRRGLFSSYRRYFVVPVLAAFLGSMAAMSHAADPPGAPDVAGMESILSRRLPVEGPGEVVLVARDGKILFSHGYGMADREKRIPATPATRFRIGSVTKQFTAAAILRLAEEGKLSLDDPLAKYFPTYPGGDKITLRHLLTHTSGLHNYTAHPDFMMRVVHPVSPAVLVAYFQDDPPDFPPGEQFKYSNSGYVLLGQIVEKVSGLSLGDYLQKQFFGPLGLQNTGTWHNAAPPDDAAKGYSFREGQIAPAIDWDMSWAEGAGDLYSTVGDLWRWTEALYGGRVLSPESLRTMTTEVTVPRKDTLTMRYGMGVYRCEVEWLPAIGHDGAVNGYMSSVMWFPEEKMTLCVLSNAFPAAPNTVPAVIMPIAVRTFLGPEITAHKPKVDPSIDPKSYPDYVGRYDYKTGVQEITLDRGHLFAQLTGQQQYEIFPYGRDAFFFKVVAARVIFQRGPSGEVEAILHTQNGKTITAPKLSDHDVVNLTTQQLDAVVGQYSYGPFKIMTIARQGNQLYAQMAGQPAMPIFARSDHEFYAKIVPASLEFARGPDGKIIGVTHRQGGTTLYAPRLGP